MTVIRRLTAVTMGAAAAARSARRAAAGAGGAAGPAGAAVGGVVAGAPAALPPRHHGGGGGGSSSGGSSGGGSGGGGSGGGGGGGRGLWYTATAMVDSGSSMDITVTPKTFKVNQVGDVQRVSITARRRPGTPLNAYQFGQVCALGVRGHAR
jgi:hypothetical protein